MAETYEVVAKVLSQKGTCGAEHKVGDQWVIGHIVGGKLLEAWQVLGRLGMLQQLRGYPQTTEKGGKNEAYGYQS